MTVIKDPHLAMARAAEALSHGDFAAAERGFAEAAALSPYLADAWFNLGWVQRARRRFEPALESYARALQAKVAGPEEAHVNRAAILADHLFQPDAAIVEYEMALRARPGFPPALLGLGQLHEDEGRREDAAACYRRLLAAQRGNGRALARLALLDLGTRDPAEVAARVERELGQAKAADDRAELLFALATARDTAGEYGRAFAALREGNALAAALSPARYDPRAFVQLVDRLITAFPQPLPAAEPEPDWPIFLCGLFRSGSTLAERILARHSALEGAGELDAVPAIAASIQPYPEQIASLDNAARSQMRKAYGQDAARIGAAGRLIDKRCDNFVHLGLIQTLWPGAKIIHTERHPLDNLLSTYFLRFGDGVAYGHRIEDAVHHAIQHARLMRHWRTIMPERIASLDYDQLVQDPRAALVPVLAFLGCEWEDRLLDPDIAGPVRTASNWQVRQPLHRRSSGRWRHYADQLASARAAFREVGLLPDD